MSPIQSLCTWRGSGRGGLGSSEAWPQARQGWRYRNSCPAVHGDPGSAGTSYGHPRGPVPSQGWGLSQSPSSTAKRISWDQGSFCCKLPLKSRVGLKKKKKKRVGLQAQCRDKVCFGFNAQSGSRSSRVLCQPQDRVFDEGLSSSSGSAFLGSRVWLTLRKDLVPAGPDLAPSLCSAPTAH